MAKKELFIPKVPGVAAEDVFIRVNGKCVQIPRGKRVKVDECFVKEYERSLKAQERYENTAEKRLYKDQGEGATAQSAGQSEGVVD